MAGDWTKIETAGHRKIEIMRLSPGAHRRDMEQIARVLAQKEVQNVR